MRKPASKEITSDSVELWETEVCFLNIPLFGTNFSSSEDTKKSPRSWFRIFKVTSKVWVLGQYQSALLCCTSQVAILSVVTHVVSVRCQTSQTFVTSSFLSMLWLLAANLFKDHRTSIKSTNQFVPNIGILSPFASKMFDNFTPFPVFPFWTDAR